MSPGAAAGDAPAPADSQGPASHGPDSQQPAPQAPDSPAPSHPARRCSFDEARRLAAAVAPLPIRDDLPLTAAVGHVLARPLMALTDLPPFDAAAMDGWAVVGDGPWTVVGQVLAGSPPPEHLGPGQAVGIATGARMPVGATAVLRREHGSTAPGPRPGAGPVLTPTPDAVLAPGRDVRPRGLECRTGDELVPSGTPITPALVGLAAAAGYDALPAHPRPTVQLLVLGDELLTDGLPRGGRVRDALGPMLPPWLERLGARVTGCRVVGDDLPALRAALEEATADVVVTTGGTASGPVDHVHRALELVGGRLVVDEVMVRPGHPMLLARLPGRGPDTQAGGTQAGGTQARGTQGEGIPTPGTPAPTRHLVGLPGNPLAAVAGVVTLLAPLLRALAGSPEPGSFPAEAAADLPGHPHDTRLLPVVLSEWGAAPVEHTGPGMLRGLATADGLAVVPAPGARRGDVVEIMEVPT
ncbi:molybdopterin molybdotransferase MoeA [Allostreptomyces psammosilenae]|uniref:Molybdopterin molybdenumtransferase n=1 Tax=Allostreptomyces psammosilenae TaxID=1892865 RepID=A0A852ZU03_9ACTN|nr:molybdopterin molybdotransferase MoeA [Allostreptomyces psammosilenae]NYI05355.1 molybdopterin molybdotransferase [Allostreptomyces psammosilenae]